VCFFSQARVCLVALCGGASFSPNIPLAVVEGMIWSRSGICRPFSDDADGTAHADGAGLVCLVSPQAAADFEARARYSTFV
jgi:acyl transferase domain-containing protein